MGGVVVEGEEGGKEEGKGKEKKGQVRSLF